MTTLTALPNELLLLIFTSCPSISSAVRLSGVSRSLRTVWLENTELVTKEILQPHIPAYDEASKLAKYECGEGAHLSQYLPHLLRNAELAQDVAVLWEEYAPPGPTKFRTDWNLLTPIHASYYVLRQLVNSYSDKDLQRSLSATIDAVSLAEANTHYHLCMFMCLFMDEDERLRQGMAKVDESLWTEDERMEGYANKDEWKFALDVVALVMREKWQLGYSHPQDPCPWTFGNVCCAGNCRRGERWPDDVRPAGK